MDRRFAKRFAFEMMRVSMFMLAVFAVVLIELIVMARFPMISLVLLILCVPVAVAAMLTREHLSKQDRENARIMQILGQDNG